MIEILALSRLLQQFGPLLGRPRVDTLKGSRHSNMKELRFAATDGEWRIAFAFDTRRGDAILKVAGDKSGGGEKRLYRGADPQGGSIRLAPIWPSLKEGKAVTMATNVEDVDLRKLSPAQAQEEWRREPRRLSRRGDRPCANCGTRGNSRRFDGQSRWAQRRTARPSRGSKSAAIYCCQHCGRPSKPWAVIYRWSPSSPIVRRSF